MRVDVYEGPHQRSIQWLDIADEDCAAELRTSCRMCRQAAYAHVAPHFKAELERQYRDRWPVAYFAVNGWQADDVDNGICPKCQDTMGLIKWSNT